jgi:hypothetical protein
MATKQTTLDELRAGLGGLTRERDELKSKLSDLENRTARPDLESGARSAVETLTPIIAQRDASRSVLASLEERIANVARQVRAAEAEETAAAQAAARTESLTILRDVIAAVDELGALIGRHADASRRAGESFPRTGYLTTAISAQRQAWEADPVVRPALGLPNLPSDHDRELVDARARVAHLERRLAEVKTYRAQGADEMRADVEQALGQAKDVLAILEGKKPAPKPPERSFGGVTEYGSATAGSVGPIKLLTSLRRPH